MLQARHVVFRIAVVSLFIGACVEDDSPPELIAIEVDPSLGATVSEPVIFTASTYEDGKYSYNWDFGDGQTSSSKKPSHRYESAGSYVVSVTVSNSRGEDTETERITVSEPDADLYFWTNTPFNGLIQVSLSNGMTRMVTAYYGQFPGCGKNQGFADFVDLPFGTYEYMAVAESGRAWRGIATLNKQQCVNILLN